MASDQSYLKAILTSVSAATLLLVLYININVMKHHDDDPHQSHHNGRFLRMLEASSASVDHTTSYDDESDYESIDISKLEAEIARLDMIASGLEDQIDVLLVASDSNNIIQQQTQKQKQKQQQQPVEKDTSERDILYEGDKGGEPGEAVHQPSPQQQQQQQCRLLRDVSHYSTSTVRIQSNLDNHQFARHQNSKYNSCLQFKCNNYKSNNNNKALPCDSSAPTIYNDPNNPPCCVQILRDMAAAFDSIMCTLGFEYFTSYGTLLGLVRNDTLIPWTADNDFIITEHTLAAMYDISPEEKQVWDDHGLDFFFDNFYHRVCITPTFMGGELAKLWTSASSLQWYPLVYPYGDIFIAREEKMSNMSSSSDVIVDQLGCAHPMESFRPAQRRGVYHNSFQVSMPNDAEKVLTGVYGPTWRIPDAEKRPHGDTKCKR